MGQELAPHITPSSILVQLVEIFKNFFIFFLGINFLKLFFIKKTSAKNPNVMWRLFMVSNTVPRLEIHGACT